MEEQSKRYLTKFNVFSFSAGGFGQNLIIGVVNSYLLYFYTDVFKIGLAATTVLMLCARIFDALNDPVMGTIVDKTHTRFGKLRPYLLATPIPLMILTIAVFCAPQLSPAGKVAYASVTYVLWGITYTICDVPFWGLASAMTPNPDERVKFITFSRLFHSIGGALPMVMLPLSEIFFGEKTTTSYLAMAILVGIVGAGMFSFAFFGSTERVIQSSKSPSLKECIGYLIKNKPLLTVVGANVAGFARAIAISAGLYIANYLVYDIPSFLSASAVNTAIVASWGVSGFLGMLLSPKLVKKFDYRQLYLICCAVGFGAMLITIVLGLTVGYSMYIFVLAFFLTGMPYGLVCNINYAMIAESIDYVEWIEGKRTEGVSVSMQTLMNKMMTALQMALIPLTLIVVKFVEPTDEVALPEQSNTTKLGIFLLCSAVPALGWLLNGLVISRYKLVGKLREKMYSELAERRKAAEEAQ